jgi:hypothetical protein
VEPEGEDSRLILAMSLGSPELEEFIQCMYARAVTNMSETLISVVIFSSGSVAEARRRVQEDRHQL